MLVLSRKLKESVVIDGTIIVKVLRIDGDTVKLGIQAPPEMGVHREEVYQRIEHANAQGKNPAGDLSPGLSSTKKTIG